MSEIDENRKITEQRIDFVVPGMELARDVCSSDGKILFNKSTVLSQANIQKLTNWGIPKIYIYSEVASVNPITDPQLQKFINTYNQSVTVVQKAFDDIRSTQEIPIETFSATADTIAENVSAAGNIIDQLYNLPPCDDYTMYHFVNVSAIAALIAIWLKYPPESVSAISLAGLLHDVGKSMLEPELLKTSGKLSPDNYKKYKQHVTYGYDLVKKIPNISQSIADAVFQHHERPDGSGYPQGIKNEDIHPYAKIIAIADLYDEGMTINREDPQAALSPYLSLQKLRDGVCDLDAKVCLTFINNMTNFLSGNKVILTDGRQGRVVYINKEQPAYSMVQLEDGRVIDLSDQAEICIQCIAR